MSHAADQLAARAREMGRRSGADIVGAIEAGALRLPTAQAAASAMTAALNAAEQALRNEGRPEPEIDGFRAEYVRAARETFAAYRRGVAATAETAGAN